MDMWRRRPAEPEERDDEQGSAEASEGETSVLFDGGPVSVAGFGSLEDGVVVDENSARND